MKELEKNKIDGDVLGEQFQKKVQKVTEKVQSGHDDPVEHDGFPARSSKRAAVKTYQDYAAESLSKGGGSLTKMIIAEREKKREKNRHSKTNPKNLAISFLSIVFIFLGLAMVVGAFFLVQNIQDDPRGKEVMQPQPFILYDYRSEIYTSSITRSRLTKAIEDELENTTIEIGALKYTYFATDNVHGGKTLMTTSQFLDGLRAKVSSAFIRTLGSNFMYGIYSTTENEPFLIFKTDNFDTAYAEILQWERSIGLDLGTIMGRDDFDYSRSNFVDVVFYNHDARAVLDIEGKVVLGYSFINQNTIVFFSDKMALREVIDRSQRNTYKQ